MITRGHTPQQTKNGGKGCKAPPYKNAKAHKPPRRPQHR